MRYDWSLKNKMFYSSTKIDSNVDTTGLAIHLSNVWTPRYNRIQTFTLQLHHPAHYKTITRKSKPIVQF